MKTLKKTLSLTLVFALVFSLMSMAFAAETTTTSTSATGFTDEASIQYKEAVDVMTGIGAINGYTDGSVKPQGSITREEAAKMISYAVLGKDVADKLSVSNTGFTDVASDRWSAPYIAYLVGEGVISGMGDGTFAPTANVTGYQMAKMMLCAAGYGAKGEFTGNGWELPVAVAANKAGIFDSAKATDYTKAATREEAMLYAFNGITLVPEVEYNKLYEKYDTLAQTPYTNLVTDTAATRQIAEEVYSKLTYDTTAVGGVSGHTWYLDGTKISSFVSDAKVLGTVTDGTKISVVTDPTKSAYIASLASPTVTYYYNGAAVAAYDASTAAYAVGDKVVYDNKLYVATATIASSAGWTTDSANFAEYSVTGATVTLYAGTGADSGKVASVGVVEKTVYRVTDSVIVKTTGSVTKVTIPGTTITDALSTNVSYPADLAKGDVVLIYTIGTKTYVEKASVVTGTMTGYTGTTKIVVDSKTYTLSGLKIPAAATSMAATGVSTLSTSYAGKAGTAFYLDDNGSVAYIVAASTAVTLDNTLYVDRASVTTTLGVKSAKALVVLPDGSTKVITVAKVAAAGGTLTAPSADAAENTKGYADIANGVIAESTFYTYTVNADGAYLLTAVEASNDAHHFTSIANSTPNTLDDITTPTNVEVGDSYLKITKGAANFLSETTAASAGSWTGAASEPKGILANASTVFVLKTSTGYKAYTGISNVPTTMINTTDTIDVTLNSAGYASLVVVSGANTTDSTVASSDVFFPLSAPSYVYDADTPYYTVNAMLNGSATVLKVNASVATTDIGADLAAGKVQFYAIKTTEDGIVTDVDDTGTSTASITKLTVSGGTMSLYTTVSTLGDTFNSAYVLNDSVKGYVFNLTDETFTPISADSLSSYVYGNTVNVATVPVSDDDTTIAAVIVTIP